MLQNKKMDFVYVVIENGDPYPVAYKRYNEAVAAVKLKHKEEIEEDLKYAEYGESIHEVDVPESKEGYSKLYIEKGIHIEIHKLPLKN
jgi:hypothetical protein